MKSENLGRSMIEMLGVLAIVGVLSVGGIAGFSKAMEEYKLNKAITEYSYLMQGLLEYITDIRKLTGANGSDDATSGLADVVEATGLVSASWTKRNSSTFIDPYGNLIRVFSRRSRLVIDMYLGSFAASEDGSLVSENFSPKFCRELFQNVAKPLSSAIYYVWITNTGKYFYGTNYCSGSRKCLLDLSVTDVNTACNSCVENTKCGVIFEF